MLLQRCPGTTKCISKIKENVFVRQKSHHYRFNGFLTENKKYTARLSYLLKWELYHNHNIYQIDCNLLFFGFFYRIVQPY